MIALGSPVVPDEYSTHSGWPNGTAANSGLPPASPGSWSQSSRLAPAARTAAVTAGPAAPPTMITAPRPGSPATISARASSLLNARPL